MSHHKPRFTSVRCATSLSKERVRDVALELKITVTDSGTNEPFALLHDFGTVFDSLQKLSRMLEERICGRHGPTASDMGFYCTCRSYLENCLLWLPRRSLITTVEETIRELSRLPSLIYLHRVLRDFQPVIGVLVVLKKEVMATIEEAEATRAWQNTGDQFSETLLWILCICSTLWLNDAEKDWFAQRIAAQATYQKLVTWKEIENVLVRYLWMRGMCEDKCKPIGRSVELFISAAPWMEVIWF